MRRTFKSRHQKSVEKDRGKDQRRERMQEGVAFLGFDDPVGLESGHKNDGENNDIKK